MLIPLYFYVYCTQHASKHTFPRTLTLTNRNSNPDPHPPPYASLLGWGNDTQRGWLGEMKTCLISSVANGVSALCTLCPLIGLCNSLHLKAHVIPSNLLPKHKWANPETRLRGWGGMTQLRHGKSEGCCSGGEKGASEADGGVRRSQCVIINKALKKKREHIKAYRGCAIIHESNALWLNVS